MYNFSPSTANIGEFVEDGSFIGQYTPSKTNPPDGPSSILSHMTSIEPQSLPPIAEIETYNSATVTYV